MIYRIVPQIPGETTHIHIHLSEVPGAHCHAQQPPLLEHLGAIAATRRKTLREVCLHRKRTHSRGPAQPLWGRNVGLGCPTLGTDCLALTALE